MTLLPTEDVWGWVDEPSLVEPTDLWANGTRRPLPNTSFPLSINRLNLVSGLFTQELSISFNTTAGPNWFDGKTARWGSWGFAKQRILGITSLGEFFTVELPDTDDNSTWLIVPPTVTSVVATGVTGWSVPKYTGPNGTYIYYVATDVDGFDKLFIHDSNTYALVVVLDWSSFMPFLGGNIDKVTFSPAGNFIAVVLVQTIGGSTYQLTRVYSRVDASIVFEVFVVPDLLGWAQDDSYFWYRAGQIHLIDTSSWLEVDVSALGATNEPVPHTMGPIIDGEAKWVGGTSSFINDTARGVIYNFDFSIYDPIFASGAFSHNGVEDPTGVDFMPDGEWIVVCCDNINGSSVHRYHVDDQVEQLSGNTQRDMRSRAFF